MEDNEGSTVTWWGGTVHEATYDIVIEIPRVVYHNISLGYEFDNGIEAMLGVSNAFNKKPPQVSNTGWSGSTMGRSAFYSQYDWRGRRVFFSLKKQL